jgi:hypothetical protein
LYYVSNKPGIGPRKEDTAMTEYQKRQEAARRKQERRERRELARLRHRLKQDAQPASWTGWPWKVPGTSFRGHWTKSGRRFWSGSRTSGWRRRSSGATATDTESRDRYIWVQAQ